MTPVQLLIILMIIAALIAVEAKELISSAIALSAVGLALSLCFLLLKAPDLAIILLVVEVVTLTIVVGYAAGINVHTQVRTGVLPRISAAALALLFVGVSLAALREIPLFGKAYIGAGRLYTQWALAEAGAANAVAAVALDFRGYDTIAGIAVLFLVAVGVYSFRGGQERKTK